MEQHVKQNQKKSVKLTWKQWLIAVAVSFILLGVLFGSDDDRKAETGDTAKIAAASEIPDSIAGMYKIVEDLSNSPAITNLSVYVPDTAKIKSINAALSVFYGAPDKYIYLSYFDDEQAGKGYFAKQASDGVSDAEKNNLAKHCIAKYTCNPTTKYNELHYQH